jgi:hypothetical protein
MPPSQQNFHNARAAFPYRWMVAVDREDVDLTPSVALQRLGDVDHEL